MYQPGKSLIAFLLLTFSTLSGQTFPQESRIKVGNAPGCVEIADMNNDRIPDLVITNERDSSVTVLLGRGNGNFVEAHGSPFPAGFGVNDVTIGDFNNDGILDLAFANHERKHLTVSLGTGHGSLHLAPHSPFPIEVIPHPHGIATGDFNGDGWLDLVTDSWGNDRLEILFGDSLLGFRTPGTFVKVGKHPYQRVRVADVNHDGKFDIVTTNLEGDNVTVLLCDDKGNFHEPPDSPFPAGDSPFNVAIGDVTGDGNVDLAVVNSPRSTADRTGVNGLTLLIGDGKGRFSMMKGSPFEAGRIPNRVAIGDVDGDGINDVVVSDGDGDVIRLYLMGRNETVASSAKIRTGNHPKGVAIADLNGDGKGDIVVCNNGDNDISIITGSNSR